MQFWGLWNEVQTGTLIGYIEFLCMVGPTDRGWLQLSEWLIT